MDPLSVLVCALSFDRRIQFFCIWIVHNAELHPSFPCKTDGNAAEFIIKDKVGRTVDRIDNETITVAKFLTDPVFLRKEIRLRKKLAEILDERGETP